MTHELCSEMNKTENLKIEDNQRNVKAEAALIVIIMSYYGWFLGKHSFRKCKM